MTTKQIQQLAAANAKKAPALNAVAAQQRAAEKLARLREEFEAMTGLLLITVGHETWGLNSSNKHYFVVAVTLFNGNVVSATAISLYEYGFSRGDRAYGNCTDSKHESKFQALHSPKADAVYTRKTRTSGEYECHEYSMGKKQLTYEIMKDKVIEIMENPIVVAAHAAAQAAAVNL